MARPGRRWRANIRQVKFLGALSGEALTRAYAGSDVFVFPSRTDTFGLVTLEALACGLTVAAYPVEGPRDVVGPDVPGAPMWRCWTRTCARPVWGRWSWPGSPGRHPTGLCRKPFLAGLHPAVPAQYRGRAGRGRARPRSR